MNTIIKCPQCGEPSPWNTENTWRPFCSERCKLIDFGDWANETNKIAGEMSYSNEENQDSEVK